MDAKSTESIESKAERIAEEVLPCRCMGTVRSDHHVEDDRTCPAYYRPAVASAVSKLLVENEKLREEREGLLEKAAKLGHQTAFEYLDMHRTQKMYGWHDVEDALSKGSKAILALTAIERSSRP